MSEHNCNTADMSTNTRLSYEIQVRHLKQDVAVLTAKLARAEKTGLRLKTELEVFQKVERDKKAAADALAAKMAREKALDGLYLFPEVGPGRWMLRDVEAAFSDARKLVGYRKVRGKKAGRTTLSNSRLTRELSSYGEKICTGNGANSYAIFFASELVGAVMEVLRAKGPADAA